MRRGGSRILCALNIRPSGSNIPTYHNNWLQRGLSTTGAAVEHDIAILGGGITGLANAYYLTKELPNAKITLYEAKDQIGGWLSSNRVPVKNGSVIFEAGPRTLRPQKDGVLAAKLVNDLGLKDDTIFTMSTNPAAINRFLYYPDHLVRMPHPSFGIWPNVSNLFSEPIFASLLTSVVSEPWKDARDPRVKDESVGDFFSRRIGKSVTDRILSGVIHGIYAGDLYQLSARSLFPQQWADDAQHGSIALGILDRMSKKQSGKLMRGADFVKEVTAFSWDPQLARAFESASVFTFRDGMKTLVDSLARNLWANENVQIKTGTPVEHMRMTADKDGIEVKVEASQTPRKFSHVLSALSPSRLNALTVGANRPAPDIPSVTVMTVNLYYQHPIPLPPLDSAMPGFGYLIPRATPVEQNPERALGVVFDNAYAMSKYPEDLSEHEHLADQLSDDRRLVVLNDFAWLNIPNAPVTQDSLKAPGTKLTVMLGGHWWNDWPSYPDEEEGLKMAKSVLQRHLGITQEPEAWQVNLQRDCIPQYVVGHEDKLKQAHNDIWRDYQGRLRVMGGWISGVGVNDCLRTAWDVARNLRDGKDGTGLEHVGSEEWVRVMPVRKD